MKNSLPLLVTALLAWVIGGSFLYKSLCCGFPGPALSIADGNNIIAKSNQNLFFSLGGAKPELPDPAKAALSTAANYLNDLPGKVLLVNGQFHETETSAYEAELGLTRSRRVSEILHTLGFDPARVIAGKKEQKGLKVEDEKVYGAVSFKIVDIPYYTLAIADGESFASSAANNLVVGRSSFEFETAKQEITEVFRATAEYLQKNPGKKLKITGLFHEEEENTSILPDLGLARATQIKNIFQDLGVPPEQLTTAASMENGLLFPGNLLYGAAIYNFEDKAAVVKEEQEKAVAKIEAELKQKDIKLYFERGKNSLSLTAAQRQFFADLVQYLDSKATAEVYVEGHTSNTGTRASNLELSRERAAFIKDYLVRNGLNSSQIVAAGKGQAEPISTNGTDKGRALNRRVEVFIK